MFFQQVISACQREGFSLTSTLFTQLQKDGIRADLLDLYANSSGIYFDYPNQTQQKVLLYQAKIQESTFKIHGDPLVHLCNCSFALKSINNPDYLAILTEEMRFFVGIYAHKTQIKIFYDKPLQFCPQCVQITSFKGDLKSFLNL